MERWANRVTDMLAIRYPILQAGMGYIAMAPLVAAVSEAGGMGVIGAARFTPEQLDAELTTVEELTDRPYGVDLLLPKVSAGEQNKAPEGVQYHGGDPAMQRAMLEVCYAHAVPLLVLAMYLPEGLAQEAHGHGCKVFTMIGKVRHAERAQSLGADGVIATGYEGGGHTGTIGQAVLTRAVASAVDIPVIAAGGIADGQGIASSLLLGAEGVWLGSRFVATREASVHENIKQLYVTAKEDGSIISRGLSGKTARIAYNDFAREWETRTPLPFPQQSYAIASQRLTHRAFVEGETVHTPIPMGQSTAMISDVPGAGELVRRLVAQTEQSLRHTYESMFAAVPDR